MMPGCNASRQPRTATFPARSPVAAHVAFPYTSRGGDALRRHVIAMPTEIDTVLSAIRLHAAPVPSQVTIALSVVVPVHNERENIAPLVGEIVAALRGIVPFEIVYVDDGSTDGTSAMLRSVQTRVSALRVLTHDHCAGQSTAIRTGVLAAHGRWIATLDGDGQNDPADIPALLTRACSLSAQRGDDRVLLAGWRTSRKDSRRTRWQSTRPLEYALILSTLFGHIFQNSSKAASLLASVFLSFLSGSSLFSSGAFRCVSTSAQMFLCVSMRFNFACRSRNALTRTVDPSSRFGCLFSQPIRASPAKTLPCMASQNAGSHDRAKT